MFRLGQTIQRTYRLHHLQLEWVSRVSNTGLCFSNLKGWLKVLLKLVASMRYAPAAHAE